MSTNPPSITGGYDNLGAYVRLPEHLVLRAHKTTRQWGLAAVFSALTLHDMIVPWRQPIDRVGGRTAALLAGDDCDGPQGGVTDTLLTRDTLGVRLTIRNKKRVSQPRTVLALSALVHHMRAGLVSHVARVAHSGPLRLVRDVPHLGWRHLPQAAAVSGPPPRFMPLCHWRLWPRCRPTCAPRPAQVAVRVGEMQVVHVRTQ